MIKIGNSQKPFIIAELSGNHNGSLKNAIKLVRAAARCKVDAVRFKLIQQTWMLTLNTTSSCSRVFC